MSDLNRWLWFWNEIKARGDPQKGYGRVREAYSEPHRFYHNLEHIGNCLKELQDNREIASNSNLVEAAIWFHDVIYDTKAKDNEVRSAATAHDFFIRIGLGQEFGRKVGKLIVLTKHDKVIPFDRDGQLLVDIDLSILGKSEEEYDRYEENIRKEYSWVEEHVFKVRRTGILKEFLGRNRIYLTSQFNRKYEEQARKNLERTIKGFGY